MKGPLAVLVSFNEVETRQFVSKTLHQIGMDTFLLPLLQHGIADGIGSHCGHIVYGQLSVGSCQIDSRVERISTEMADDVHLALR